MFDNENYPKILGGMMDTMYWSDLAELTHETQVEKFGFCTCEEKEEFPYEDCPRTMFNCTRCGEDIDLDQHCESYDTVCNYCCGCGCGHI